MSELRYLYRRTTEGWPGNSVLRDQRITCTTTDPVVASHFGVECRNHGHAVILVAREDAFVDLIVPSDYFEVFESPVNLMISPLDFARKAKILEVDDVLRILAEMGFDQLPLRIRDKWALRDALIGSYEAGQRLNHEQLLQFSIRLFGAGP
jgi:hypothetical protein